MGKANQQGYRLETDPITGRARGFKFGLPYELAYEHGRLVALGYNLKLMGAALEGLELRVIDDKKAPIYNIHIDRVRPMPVTVGYTTQSEAYMLGWTIPGNPNLAGKNICNSMLHVPESDLLGMYRDEVVIFAGDRIDVDTLTMQPDPDNLWINFGCTGHTLAKLYLTRNTSVTDPGGDWRAHQATLKMLTADYCGKGVPMTVSGTPILWAGGYVDYALTATKLEARWDENGATCVNHMRLLDYPNWEFFPSPMETLLQHCMPTPCDNTSPKFFGDALRVSAMP